MNETQELIIDKISSVIERNIDELSETENYEGTLQDLINVKLLLSVLMKDK